MRQFEITLVAAFLIGYCLCDGSLPAFSTTESIKLVVIGSEDSPEEHKQSILIDSANPQYAIREPIRDDHDTQYLVEEVDYPENVKKVDVNVTVHEPESFNGKQLPKKIDVNVDVKKDGIENFHDSDDKKYKVKVRINKNDSEHKYEEENSEGILIKLVRTALKYTGF